MKATFNDQEHEFHIDRAHIPYLEHSLGRSLYAVLRDFTEGRWTFDDVASVVSFALHGPGREEKQAIAFAEHGRAAGFPVHYGTRYSPHRDVIATLQREGHGNFAPLAADVLTFTIFGETHGSD